ncbi:MAG: ELKS/Rab6-interacting/CAST family protein [Alphaproteobacteria bacterium]|nr:ELKS/Rab6-interacting/CAST family protein [Alphaproteobacteria bacterium]
MSETITMDEIVRRLDSAVGALEAVVEDKNRVIAGLSHDLARARQDNRDLKDKVTGLSHKVNSAVGTVRQLMESAASKGGEE